MVCVTSCTGAVHEECFKRLHSVVSCTVVQSCVPILIERLQTRDSRRQKVKVDYLHEPITCSLQ